MFVKALIVSVLFLGQTLFFSEIQPLGAAPPSDASAPHPKKQSPPSSSKKDTAPSPQELQAQQDLKALRSNPEEYRILVLGVQIFLGRFGYGTGPYTGAMDDHTRKALRAYQKYVKLPQTGEIDLHTIQSLTQDNLTLDQPVPFLPQATFDFENWDEAITVQGTWVRKDGPTSDSVHTTRVSCIREQNYCIESTALLLRRSVPVLEVMTNIYSIDEWGDNLLVTAPYLDEPCTISILRMNKKEQTVLRFSAYHQGKGPCAHVQTEDVQFRLVNGPEVYARLKQQKAEQTKRILRVKE